MLRELPATLAVSVLQASIMPLNVQLQSIPQDLHRLAVQAAFPDITSKGSLSLDVSLVGTPAAITALSAFPSLLQASQQTAKLISISSTTRFQGPFADKPHNQADNLDPFITTLRSALESQPEVVDLSGLELSSDLTATVMDALASLSEIRELSIRVPAVEERSMSLLSGLATFTWISSLCIDSLERISCFEGNPCLEYIQHLTNLTKLVLRGHYEKIHGGHPATFLQSLPCLRELELPAFFQNALAHAGGQMSYLTSLTLVQSSVEKKTETHDVSLGLLTLTALRTLDMQRCRLPSEEPVVGTQLAASFQHLPQLQSIKLPELYSTSQIFHTAAVLDALPSTSLTSLSLKVPSMRGDMRAGPDGRVMFDGRITREHFTAAWATICGMSSLRDLTVVGCNFHVRTHSDRSALQVGRSTISQLKALTSLYLSGDLPYELDDLSKLTCLQVLHVKCTRLPDEDVQELLCSLACLPRLTNVAVAYELHTCSEVQLCEAFRRMTSVTSLDMSGWSSALQPQNPSKQLRPPTCSLGSSSADVVCALSQMRVLNISHRRIDSATAVSLKNVLPALQCLVEFNMAGCSCGQELIEITQGLGAVTGLERLDLSFNDLSCAASDVAVAFGMLRNLQYVNLRRSNLWKVQDLDVVVSSLQGMSGLLTIDLSLNIVQWKCGQDSAASVQPGTSCSAVVRPDALDLCSALVGLIRTTPSLRCVLVQHQCLLHGDPSAFEQLQECLEHATMSDTFRLMDLCRVCDSMEPYLTLSRRPLRQFLKSFELRQEGA